MGWFNFNKNRKVKNISSEAFREGIQNSSNVVILDVRRPDEWAGGVIPKAKLINFMDRGFPEEIAKLDKDAEYYVYCRSGNRSGKACRYMEEQGFTHLYNLRGGMMAWNGEVVVKQ